MKVREIMKKPEVIEPEASIQEAAEKMKKFMIGSLIVVKDRKVVGIVTDGDITTRFIPLNKLPSEVKVREIMTSGQILKVEPDDNVEDASHLMAEKYIEHLPVIINGRLIGIIAASDIIAHADELGIDTFF